MKEENIKNVMCIFACLLNSVIWIFVLKEICMFVRYQI